MHLIMDGFAHRTDIMTSEEAMRKWMVQVVLKADMRPFGHAYVEGYPWPGSSDWTALTAFQPLMESGLSVHCWPEKSAIFIDLFSCNRFNERLVRNFIASSLDMWRYHHRVLPRGVNSETGEIMLVPSRG